VEEGCAVEKVKKRWAEKPTVFLCLVGRLAQLLELVLQLNAALLGCLGDFPLEVAKIGQDPFLQLNARGRGIQQGYRPAHQSAQDCPGYKTYQSIHVHLTRCLIVA
jgi:hypothetical protein